MKYPAATSAHQHSTGPNMTQKVFASLFAALVAVSAQVIPPSQNSATSASENLNTAHYYNQNFYARDESSIRQHSTTFGNNAEGTMDVATATSDPLLVPPIEPLYSHRPAQHPHLNHNAPYPVFGPAPESANTVHNLPTVSQFAPIYASYIDPLYLYYALPSTGYYPWQHALPVSHTHGTANVPFLNPAIEGPPMYFVDPTLLQPQDQVHNLATSNLRSLTAAANPHFASSDSVTDSKAYSKDVLYVAQPIVF